MNVLVIGSGGREHTLAWKINQSSKCNKLFVMPGNAGTNNFAENVDIEIHDFEQIGQFVIHNQVDLVVVGPEAPLVAGIKDFFSKDKLLKDIAFVGPDKLGSQLEGSKDFAKTFMQKYNVPTAGSKTFTSETVNEAKDYILGQKLPIVLKADGLAAGKGVLICQSHEEAIDSVENMLVNQMFGKASEKVVIEDFLDGIEVSIFVLTDGKDYVIFPEAKDYKRIGENDSGPNTGGMGSVSPVNFADKKFLSKVEERIIKPTIRGLSEEGFDYKGFIFIGLMNMGGEPFVIEYNVRMGDPESQVVIPRIENDFVELLMATGKGELGGIEILLNKDTAVTVVLAAGGYPGNYQKGKVIFGLDDIKEGIAFHAGTVASNEEILTNGGRVLAITNIGKGLNDAIAKTYKEVSKISWEGFQYRKDIGQDLLKLEK